MKRLSILLPALAIGLCLVFILLSRLGPASGAAPQPKAEGLTQAQIIEALKKASTRQLGGCHRDRYRKGRIHEPRHEAHLPGQGGGSGGDGAVEADFDHRQTQISQLPPPGAGRGPCGERSGLCLGKWPACFRNRHTSWPPPPRSGGWAGAVIDGAARDIEEIERIGFPVYSRAVSPATVVGALRERCHAGSRDLRRRPGEAGRLHCRGQRWRGGGSRRQGRRCAGLDPGIR